MGPAVAHGTRRSTRVARSTAVAVCSSMKETSSSRVWNLSDVGTVAVVDMEHLWVGRGLLVVGCWKTELDCGTATRIGALLRVPRLLGHFDQLSKNVGQALTAKQPVAQDRVADQSLVDGDRDRTGVFGDRHRR